MPKVSVIMPSLNVVDYIREAIRSVREQTMTDLEIICIDAGSADGTWEIIQEEAAQDRRITAVRSPVRSYGFQVNMGLDLAGGDYIAILETDDFADAEMYGALYRLAKEQDLDYAKCDYDTYITDKNGNRIFSRRRITPDNTFYDKPFLPKDHPQLACDDWYLWNGIYRAQFLKNNKIRFSETRGAAFQDIGFLHKTAVLAEKAQYMARSLYRYCVDREDASSSSDRTLFYARKEYGLLLEHIGDEAQPKEWAHVYRRMAKSFTRACMDLSDEMLLEKDVGEICRWFQRRLAEAQRWGFLSEDDLPASLRNVYRHAVNPADGLLAYRKNRSRELSDFLGEGNPIVIFGCGLYGREARGCLKKSGYEVSFYMDNSSTVWNTTVDGVMVISPEKAKELSPETRYIIANEKYAGEMQAQLESYVNNVKVFCY